MPPTSTLSHMPCSVLAPLVPRLQYFVDFHLQWRKRLCMAVYAHPYCACNSCRNVKPLRARADGDMYIYSAFALCNNSAQTFEPS